MSLINALSAFWRFEESSGSAIDATGNGRDFTWNVAGRVPPHGPPVTGQPARITGVVNYGVDLNDAYLWTPLADWNLLQGTSFTWAGLIKPHHPVSLSNDIVLSSTNNYTLDWDDGNSKFTWQVFKQGGGSVTVSSPVVTVDEWHTLRAWLDLDASVIGIQVDCGEIVTSVWSGSLNNDILTPGGEMCFGRDDQFFPQSVHELDAWGLWTRVIDTGEAALLCPGIEYPFGHCLYLAYGTYEFSNTFYPAEDGVEWSPSVTPLVRDHGGRAIDFFVRPRRLLVKGGEIQGPLNTSDWRDRIDAIKTALAAQPQNLYFEPDRYWRDVRVEYFRNPYGPTHFCRISADIEISFLARDPFQYGIAVNTDTWTGPTNAGTHSLPTIGGNIFARPNIAFVIGGAGAQTIDWTLENTTTGESFRLAGSVTGGQTINVDCLNQTVQIGTTDEIALFDGEFLRLDVGANSYTITVTSGSITSLTTTWRTRHY